MKAQKVVNSAFDELAGLVSDKPAQVNLVRAAQADFQLAKAGRPEG